MAASNINENIFLEEVMATHDPDNKNFKTNIIFNFVKNILYHSMIGDSIDGDVESDEEDSNGGESNHKVSDEDFNDMELPNQLKRVSFEILLKSSSSDDVNPHSNVIYFLRMLSTYSWEAKLMMMLVALSLNFGEFSLVHAHKGLAHKLKILKGSESLEVVLSHMRGMVTHFVKLILHLTEYVVELAQSSTHNSSPIIPIACYWIFTSVLAYASYFTCFPTLDSKWLIVEGTQLSDLTAKIKDIISDCRPILEKKREEDCYKALCYAFSYENPIPASTNNLDVLKLLFNVKNGSKKKLIYDCYEGKMVGHHLLKNKSLLLLISSSLDIDNYLLSLIFKLFQRRTKLRVLWIPILDCPTKNMKKQYRDLASIGDLLAVENIEESVTPGFIRFVKEKLLLFQIGGEPIIVSLDHHGRIVHHNAMHMILMRVFDIHKGIRTGVEIGDSIIPFLLQNVLKDKTLAIRSLVSDIDVKLIEIAGNMERVMIEGLDEMQKQIQNPVYSNIYTSEKEKDLWKIETWCTKLLLGVAAEPLIRWVDENKYIFLIGGNDLKWVKKFDSKVMAIVSLNPQLTITMGYIGSNVKVGSMIYRDNICQGPSGASESWFIWARLRSTFLSRIKFIDQIYCDEDGDEIVEGLKKILAYEAKDLAVDGWAMLCKGNKIVVCDLGDKILTIMNEYEKWKESAIVKGFDQAFKDHHHEMLASIDASKHHPCCALDYPCNFDKVPQNVKCPQCCYNMQKFVTFRCYHGIVDDRDFNCEDFD